MDKNALSTHVTTAQRIRGCLLGGAVGDALGGAIEFMSLDAIRTAHGVSGLKDYANAYGRLGAITDDTQMTLFTAEGLLRAWVRSQQRGICGISGVVHHAYLRWGLTQNVRPRASFEIGTDGWLFEEPELHHRRAPGNTCLAAILASTDLAVPLEAANDSKGCGGVMRVAPVGLLAAVLGDDAAVFDLGTATAALTHGHVTGALPAGYLAVMIAAILRGDTLFDAMNAADRELEQRQGHGDTAKALELARALAERGRPKPEDLERLGGGWVAEEALAIAVCCALTADDFKDAVLMGANHSGDSDSTASIAGNLVGALKGEAAIPSPWLSRLELRSTIEAIAEDICQLVQGNLDADTASARYPGW